MIRFRAYYKEKMYYDWGYASELGKLFFLHYSPETIKEVEGRGYVLPEIKPKGDIVFNEFTRVLDRMGNPIYVDDYVIWVDQKEIVYFDDKTGRYMAGSSPLMSNLMTVSGNIHISES
jgi:hypothetical protein